MYRAYFHILVDQDYEVSLDQIKKSKIKLSPIPQAEEPTKFCFPVGPENASSAKSKEEIPRNSAARESIVMPLGTAYEELNYEEVLSKTGPRLEMALNELMNQDEDQKEDSAVHVEEIGDTDERTSNRLSSSRAQQEDDNPINPIKDFATKTSRIFADSEASKLNSSAMSQRMEPFLITNSSVVSTYLYKPQFPPSHSNFSSNLNSQVPSPSKNSFSIANCSTGFRSTGDYPRIPVTHISTGCNRLGGTQHRLSKP